MAHVSDNKGGTVLVSIQPISQNSQDKPDDEWEIMEPTGDEVRGCGQWVSEQASQ